MNKVLTNNTIEQSEPKWK